MTSPDITDTLLSALMHLLKPVIRILLRHGVGYHAFNDVAKRAFVEVARQDFAIPGKAQTTSRISTVTGMSRKEVARLQETPDWRDRLDTASVNRAARVISGWVRDPSFHDAAGEPADLPFEGEAVSFTALVKRYSGDITARTIADELVRVGAIRMSGEGRVRLLARAYVPIGGDLDKIAMLGTDVAGLIATIDHNLTAGPGEARFQRKVAYSHIPLEAVPGLRKELEGLAQSALEGMDRRLSEVDRAGAQGSRSVRLGVGIYYFEGEQA